MSGAAAVLKASSGNAGGRSTRYEANAATREPAWVKWVQVFGIGLGLGAARARLGLEACVGLHLGFNLIGALIVPPELAPPPM